MKILALDLGTHTGWAWTGPAGPVGGVENFTPRRHESQGMKWLRFERWLDEVLIGIDLVAYEEVRFHGKLGGVDVAHTYGAFRAIVQKLCVAKEIEYTGVEVKTLKKSATGKGNASKEMMIDACRTHLGVDAEDDNEADARLLLHHMLTVEKFQK